MMFEVDGIKFVQPLDLYLGPRYTNLVDNNMELDALEQLYTITIGTRPYYINNTAYGSLSWKNI
jgi:hypothetical protein